MGLLKHVPFNVARKCLFFINLFLLGIFGGYPLIVIKRNMKRVLRPRYSSSRVLATLGKFVLHNTHRYVERDLAMGYNYERSLPPFVNQLTICGENYLKELNQGNTIIVSAHVGRYFILPGILARLGYQCDVVIDVEQNLFKGLSRQERLFSSFLNRKLNFITASCKQEIRKRLIAGSNIMLLADFQIKSSRRNATGELFGHPVQIPLGPVWFARICTSRIIPIFLIRAKGLKSILFVEPPIESETIKKGFSDIIETSQYVFSFVAPYIERYPQQWTHWHNLHKILIDP
ncbi:hypothetical protein JYT87_01210 [Nitrospira defluvii]|nr:hypothetical protein [Nitrospira defluvii]